MGDISDFVGELGTGIARKSRYQVEIYGPRADRALNMRCESISFPGQNVRSVPDTLRFGPAREHGQGMTYGPFSATFICSPDMREKTFFEEWQSGIINLNTWEPKYYDTYKGYLIITQLDERNNPTYTINVEEAYPKTIMPQDVGHAQGNAYQTIGIEFTYRFWRPGYLPETMEDEDGGEDYDPGVINPADPAKTPDGKTRSQKQAAAMRYVPDRMPGDVRTKRPGSSTAIWKRKNAMWDKQIRSKQGLEWTT